MKSRFILCLVMAALATGAQAIESPGLMSKKINGYVGLAGRASTILNDRAGYGDVRAALQLKNNWAVGLSASGLVYDKKLSTLVQDGTYRLNLAYSGVFVEKLFSLSRNVQLSLSLMTGLGVAQYLYDKEYRREKVWKEEIIDQTTFGVQELNLNVMHRLTGPWWIGMVASLRHSAPVEMIATPENLIKNGGMGFSLKRVF